MKQTFSLTWVEYEDDDPLGFMWALITLSPVFIMVFYASILVIHRDFHTLFLTLGQLLNEVLNFGLKYLFKQPRPSDTHLEGHGMPSAHAQFMMFFALYMMLFAVYRVREMPRIEKCIIGSGAHFLAILVCYSRYHLRYHTLDQIAVGSTIGAMTGSCWFGIIHLVRRRRHLSVCKCTQS